MNSSASCVELSAISPRQQLRVAGDRSQRLLQIVRSYIGELPQFVVRPRKFPRALFHAPLEFRVEAPHILLGAHAFGDLLSQLFVLLLQHVAVALENGVLAGQIDEDRHLGPQHFRDDRLIQIIDGSHVVAAKQMFLALERGQEDDRRVFRPLALPDHGGGFEAVHVGHLDVEQNRCEIVFKTSPQRLLAGLGLDQFLAESVENGLERDQVLRLVVDQQDLDRHPAGELRASLPLRVATRSLPFIRACSFGGLAECLPAAAKPGAARPVLRERPASECNPRRRPQCISPDRLSSPWPSAR